MTVIERYEAKTTHIVWINMDQSQEKAQRHNQRMVKQKQVVDKKIAEATEDRGVIVLLTGNGKGKSSSAFGMLARSLGHGQKCAVTQFIKGQVECGENKFFADHPRVEFHLMKTGFTWETQNYEADKAEAEKVWQKTLPLLQDESTDLIILDEITYMFKFKYLEEESVIETLLNRPQNQSVILTGRGASKNLIAAADTVSEINLQKHAFNSGVKARLGVEW